MLYIFVRLVPDVINCEKIFRYFTPANAIFDLLKITALYFLNDMPMGQKISARIKLLILAKKNDGPKKIVKILGVLY